MKKTKYLVMLFYLKAHSLVRDNRSDSKSTSQSINAIDNSSSSLSVSVTPIPIALLLEQAQINSLPTYPVQMQTLEFTRQLATPVQTNSLPTSPVQTQTLEFTGQLATPVQTNSLSTSSVQTQETVDKDSSKIDSPEVPNYVAPANYLILNRNIQDLSLDNNNN